LCRISSLKHVIDGKIERTRRGERIKQLQEGLKEARLYRNMQEGATDRSLLENSLWKKGMELSQDHLLIMMMMMM
jgi:hypothetical protein